MYTVFINFILYAYRMHIGNGITIREMKLSLLVEELTLSLP